MLMLHIKVVALLKKFKKISLKYYFHLLFVPKKNLTNNAGIMLVLSLDRLMLLLSSAMILRDQN